jgi:hypothetical protein
VDYWLGLPIIELLEWFVTLADQLEQEHAAQERS